MVPFWLLRLLEVVTFAVILRGVFGTASAVWASWYFVPVQAFTAWCAIVLANRRRPLRTMGFEGWLSIVLIAGIAAWLTRPAIEALHLWLNHGQLNVLTSGSFAVHLSLAFLLVLVVVLTKQGSRTRCNRFLRSNARLAIFGAAIAATSYPLAIVSEVPVHARITYAVPTLQPMDWAPVVAQVAAAGCVLTGYALYAMATTARARSRLAPYHARHCHSCGYDLFGVEQHTCPECDHPISPEQRESLRREPPA